MPHHLRFDRNLNMAQPLKLPQYSEKNIIIIVTNVILEFFSARFVHTGAAQQTILSF